MIPVAFELYNKMHLFGKVEENKLMYAARLSGRLSGAEPGYASQCVACGDCLQKCPQQLDIPDFMAAVADEMEDDHLAARLAMAQKMFRIKAP